MVQFKGTPGPWVADIRGGCAAIYPQDRANDTPGLHSDDSRNIAYSCKGTKFNGMHWELDKSVEHDFRVMAAAPELLEALTYGQTLNLPDMLDWVADRLVNVHGENCNLDFILSIRERASKARAAINKATGETK